MASVVVSLTSGVPINIDLKVQVCDAMKPNKDKKPGQ
jgi:hypothetical protein